MKKDDMENEECANCRFWHDLSPDDYDNGGRCRRFPRTVIVFQETEQDSACIDSFYPTSYADDWCGEWQGK